MKRIGPIALLFTALTVAMAYPWSLHPATQVLANMPDIHLYIWTLAWDVHAFLHNPLTIFDANIFFPFGNTLAYSENLIGSAFIAAPIIWLTHDPMLAMNLVALSSCALCGIGAYLLGRRVGLGVGAAILAGIVFAFAPPRFMRMGQIHITAVQWVPFTLAFVHSYFDRGRARDLRLAIFFFALQALTGGHGAVFALVSVILFIAYRLIAGDPLAIGKWLKDGGVAGVLLIMPAVLMFLPYRRAQHEVGLVRSLEGWLPTPESYLASPSHLHQYILSLFTATKFNEEANAWLFPGYLPVLLGLVALIPAASRDTIRAQMRRSSAPLYAVIALVSFFMFMPPPLSIWPHVYWMPALNFIRVPSRFMVLTMLALALLAGMGFDRLTGRLRPMARTLAAILVGALVLGEYASQPFTGVPFAVEIPAIDHWMDTLPKPFAIAEVPVPSPGNIGAFERQQTMAMLHSMAHWQKTVHGYSGVRPQLQWEILVKLTAFPDAPSMEILKSIKVNYVVVHSDQYTPEKWKDVEARLEHFEGLRLLHTEGAGRVYEVMP